MNENRTVRIRKVTTLFAVFSALVVAILVSYSTDTQGRFAPRVPGDLFHTSVINNAGCLTCHTPGKQVPLRDTHPSRTDCLSCHKVRPRR